MLDFQKKQQVQFNWKLRIPPDLSLHFPFQEALSESVPHLVSVLH